MYHGFDKNIKRNFMLRRNDSRAGNLHIIMISEGWCDTEDLSNDW